MPPSNGPGDEVKCGNWLRRLLTGLELFWCSSAAEEEEMGKDSVDSGRGE